MNWLIYDNGEHINTIYADEDFVKSYCEENGYTYEMRDDDEREPVKPDPTTEERLSAVEQAILMFLMEG